MARRSRKSFEGWRRKHIGDLKYMVRCCASRRLPPGNLTYLDGILAAPHALPPPAEIAKQVRLTNDQREAYRLWSIPPIDRTKEQLIEQRKEKDKIRKMLRRRKAGVQARAAYLACVKSTKPWIAMGISRATYFRRKAKMALGSSGVLKSDVRLGPSGPLNSVRLGPSAHIYTNTGHTQSHLSKVHLPLAFRGVPGSPSVPWHEGDTGWLA